MARIAFAVAARPADPPEPIISKESYRRAADADIAYLQTALAEIATSDKPLAGRTRASKASRYSWHATPAHSATTR